MQKLMPALIAVLIASLMFVWPMMFTVGLRYSLAGLLLCTTVIWWWKSDVDLFSILKCRPIAVCNAFLGLLTLWFIAQGAWIVPDATWVWPELRGQWSKDIIFWCLGLTLGVGAWRQQEQGAHQWLIGLLLGLIGLVLVNTVFVLWAWLSTGQMPRMYNGVTGSRTITSVIINMLLAFLMGDLLARERLRQFLPWPRVITITLIAICVFNTLFSSTRHGWVGLVMLTASCVVVHYINGWRHVSKKAILFLPFLAALLVSGAWISWKNDPRWHTLQETLPIAWDIDTNKAWLNPLVYPYPVLPNGEVVNDSNYERPAWIHAGLRMVLEHPLGLGYSRHAFGHELMKQYPETAQSSGAHTHSAMVDLAIGGGIPAVVLWVGLIGTLIWAGGVAYFKFGSGAGLVLLFLTSGFFGRSFMDSVMRDHSLEQFMFTVAFLLPIVAATMNRERKG